MYKIQGIEDDKVSNSNGHAFDVCLESDSQTLFAFLFARLTFFSTIKRSTRQSFHSCNTHVDSLDNQSFNKTIVQTFESIYMFHSWNTHVDSLENNVFPTQNPHAHP